MILKGEKLVKRYRHHGKTVDALDGVDISVEKGDFITVTGPSGSGKSTLLLALFGLIRITEGTILFNGARIDNLSDRKLTELRKKHVGYVLQSFALIPYLTAIQNVMIPLALEKTARKEQVAMANGILEFVGLADRKYHLPCELSAGQQQRVAIARSMIHRPQIILADEPTGNLDPELSNEILEFLTRINTEYKTTIIMVTHSPSAAGYGSRKLHLQAGRILNI